MENTQQSQEYQEAGQENKIQEMNKYERRELKRQEKKEAVKREVQKSKTKKWAVGLVIILVIALGIWLLIKASIPKGPDRGTEFPNQGQEHVKEGSTHPAYNSNPPTSGWHYSKPAPEKFYEEELPDGTLIHNLEHGDIWIAYKPTVAQEVKNELKKFAGGKVIVAPRSTNDVDVSLVAWTRLDKFNLEGKPLDKTRVTDFIKRYQNKGPEKVGSSF